MTLDLECPWCARRVSADVADLSLHGVTCPDCSTTVDLDSEEDVALPLAA